VKIPFNKPYLTGKETDYIEDAVASGKISGNGDYTKKCQRFFEERYGFKKCLLTSSCTDALEMSAILSEVGPGDEVILPSYTFVSTANPFLMRGASLIFADSRDDHPNMDMGHVASLLTDRTKVVVVVHYAGVACDMDRLSEIIGNRKILVVEDAAQAIDGYYKGRPLGSIGDLAAFSFHETKNIISGEGGMLVVNNPSFLKRAEIIWEKGTNRAAFWRGEVDKYGWVDVGSSFLPSEVTAAFLWAQLENLDHIQSKRLAIWNSYREGLKQLVEQGHISLSVIPEFSSNNAHLFYILCADSSERNDLIAHLKNLGVYAVFHYISLHRSPYFEKMYHGDVLVNADRYTDTLVRLPLFFELEKYEQKWVVDKLRNFYL
jgi:dTDP-4-amino-4,6-dideoxygalactose transaminase